MLGSSHIHNLQYNCAPYICIKNVLLENTNTYCQIRVAYVFVYKSLIKKTKYHLIVSLLNTLIYLSRSICISRMHHKGLYHILYIYIVAAQRAISYFIYI